jgi:hypothetical protein
MNWTFLLLGAAAGAVVAYFRRGGKVGNGGSQ